MMQIVIVGLLKFEQIDLEENGAKPQMYFNWRA